MSRLPSQPPMAFLEEPDDTDDEGDAESSSSEVAPSSDAASNSRDAVVGPSSRLPPSTQPAPSSALSASLFSRGKEALAKLNKPGRLIAQPDANLHLPPSAQGRRQIFPLTHTIGGPALALPATQPATSTSSHSMTTITPGTDDRTTSKGSFVGKQARRVWDMPVEHDIQTSQSLKGKQPVKTAPVSPPVTTMKVTTEMLVQAQPSSSKPSPSQAPPRPPLASSISAPAPITSSANVSKVDRLGKGKEKEVISIGNSDEDSTSLSQSQLRPTILKKAPFTASVKMHKKRTISGRRETGDTISLISVQQPSSSQKRKPAPALSTSSGDEFPPLLSQGLPRRETTVSSRSTVSDERKGGEESDDDLPAFSISQAPKKMLSRATGSVSIGRAASSHDPKRTTNRDVTIKTVRGKVQRKGKSVNSAFPSTQPTLARSSRADPTRVLPSTQPASVSRSSRRTFPIRTLGSKNKVKPRVCLGTIELLSDDDNENGKPKPSVLGAGGKNMGLIDLTLDEDDSPSPLMPAKQPAKIDDHSSTVQLRTSGPLTAPASRSSDLPRPDSPPMVRPKPFESAIPKEKLAGRKPQPAGSRPLDVSRRCSDIGGLRTDPINLCAGVAADESSSSAVQCRPVVSDNPKTHNHALREDDKDIASDGQPCKTAPVPFDSVALPMDASVDAPVPAELAFIFDAGDHMDILDMNDEFDDVAENSSVSVGPASSVEVAPRSVDNDSSPDQAEVADDKAEKRREPLEPIMRARELRSPPVSVQSKELQSPADDANEVDLILGLSTNPPGTFNSGSTTVIAQADDIGTKQQVPASTAAGDVASSKPETLTDKLDMLDLSRPANTADVLGTRNDRPKEMRNSSPLPSTSLATGTGSQPGISSPDSKLSEKSAAAERAVSPGATFPVDTSGNFMGMYYGSKNKAPSRSVPNTDGLGSTISSGATSVQGTTQAMEKIKASEGRDDMPASLAEVVELPSRCTDIISPKSAPKSDASIGSNELSTTDSAGTVSKHSVTNPDLPRSNSLSPKSKAKLRIPEVRPPRKLNIATPMRQYLLKDASTSSQSACSPFVAMTSHLPLRKESESASTSASISSPGQSDISRNSLEARATASKLKSLIPGLSTPSKAVSHEEIPSPTTNILRAATSSGLSLKTDSMPYVKKRMLEQTMQSKDSTRNASPTGEIRSISDQLGSASISGPASPKRLKSFHAEHAIDDVAENHSGDSISPAIPNLRPSTSSEEIAQVLGGDFAVLEASSETPTSGLPPYNPTPSATLREVRDVSAAPYIRFPLARKMNSKLRPRRASPLSSSPSTPVFEHVVRNASASQAPFRKRTVSAASASSSASDKVNIAVNSGRSVSKRPRIQDTDMGDVASPANEVGENTESPWQRHSSDSSADPIDILGGKEDESDSSVERSISPVTDLAGAVGEITIAPSPGSKYPVEVGRYFIERDYGPTWYHVDDIPKDFINEVNDIPDWCRNPEHLRSMFEAAILQNTVEDEPEAPRIQIINDIDDETPPFEFYYTNRMYHGHGVPPPDYRNLQGCECIDKCDPRSKTCACIKRQRQIFEKQEDDHQGFVYDDKGRVQRHQFPIFECNDACGCTEACPNRVVQNGRKCHVNIIKTQKKGWGVFAGRKIYKGSFIGIYSGELLLESEAERRGRVYNKLSRTYLFDLDFWHLERDKDGKSKYCVDAFHVGNFTRFLNHSCDPNCRIEAVYINDANIEKALLVIFAIKDISAGQEICFNYYGDDMEDELPTESVQSYQKCYCGAQNCYGRLFMYTGGTEA